MHNLFLMCCVLKFIWRECVIYFSQRLMAVVFNISVAHATVYCEHVHNVKKPASISIGFHIITHYSSMKHVHFKSYLEACYI